MATRMVSRSAAGCHTDCRCTLCCDPMIAMRRNAVTSWMPAKSSGAMVSPVDWHESDGGVILMLIADQLAC